MSRYNYDYISRAYGVDPKPGQRVTHTVTGKDGTVAHVGSQGHYVMVRFNGMLGRDSPPSRSPSRRGK